MVKIWESKHALYNTIFTGKSLLEATSQDLFLEPLKKAILYLSSGVIFFFEGRWMIFLYVHYPNNEQFLYPNFCCQTDLFCNGYIFIISWGSWLKATESDHDWGIHWKDIGGEGSTHEKEVHRVVSEESQGVHSMLSLPRMTWVNAATTTAAAVNDLNCASSFWPSSGFSVLRAGFWLAGLVSWAFSQLYLGEGSVPLFLCSWKRKTGYHNFLDLQ